ncbi:peptidase M48 [Haloferax mediterranei ATCC 33500]|nr:M48 family metalloprotease [Haloferax mediterranei]AHZ23927.1 peptidase M48 [Haloferax mediterranei ATCC 33500]ELZ98352.1 heat shock protein X [Haloferax mediterranei ATCC 33500]MDX5986674.1 M48 family metalloprotease [Haloferax mediterranei ATCC 33500]QCQ76660.1 peptidase M48 [Haloferax mediterranei ATCC 33500]
MVLIGVTILAFYLLLSALSAFAVLTLWQLRPDPVTAALAGVSIAVVLGYVSFRFGTVRLLSQLDARNLTPSESPSVYRLLERLSDEMGIEPPTLKAAHFAAPNAMALDPMGRDVVVLDAALFRLLDVDEFEALLAHELAHLERKDGLVQSLVASVLQTFVGVGYLFVSPVTFFMTGVALGSAWIRGRPSEWDQTVPGRIRYHLVSLVGVFGFGFTVLIRSQSRKREFAADVRAAEVTGEPLALASALRKLERAARPQFGLSPLWVYGEVEVEDSVSDLLSTHPSTDERVERLAAMADESMTRIEVQ